MGSSDGCDAPLSGAGVGVEALRGSGAETGRGAVPLGLLATGLGADDAAATLGEADVGPGEALEGSGAERVTGVERRLYS